MDRNKCIYADNIVQKRASYIPVCEQFFTKMCPVVCGFLKYYNLNLEQRNTFV